MNIDVELIGFLAATLTTGAFVPQVYKTFTTRSAEGLSLAMYSCMFVGILLWLLYGIKIQSLSVIVANIVTGILAFSILIMIILQKKKKKY